MATTSSSPFTPIPPTQPPCGPISLQNPFPQCTNTTEPMACFVQPTGFFCAPLATTRGFLYTLNNHTLSPFFNSSPPASTSSSSTSSFIPLVPRFSPASLVIPSNATGIDGQPVRKESPIRLGQPCSGIPTPPTTDPLYAVLVAMANQNLVNRVGHPGLGAGEDVLVLRSDCEAGSYCDYSQGEKVEGVSGEKQGLCKEQYPLYHKCASYLECISMRCDNPDGGGTTSPASAVVVISAASDESLLQQQQLQQRRRRKRRFGVGLDRRWSDKKGKEEVEEKQYSSEVLSNSNDNNINGDNMKLKKRRSEPVCLPPIHQTPGGGGGGLGESTGDSKDSLVFPHWAYALIAVLIVVGAGLVFVLTRRRRRRDGSNRKYLQNKGRRSRQRYEDESGGGNSGNNSPMMTRVRERTMSSDRTAFSIKGGNDKKKSSSSVFGRWFRGNSSNDKNDIDSGRIDLEKREAGKKSMSAVVATNNSTGASRTESVTDNGSVYSSISAFSVEEPPVAAPGVAIPSASHKVPQNGVDGASVLGLYHVDLHDESRISLAHNSNNNNNSGSNVPPSTATNRGDDEMKGLSSPSIYSGPRPAIVLPRIITTSFPESDSAIPIPTTISAETGPPSNNSHWASSTPSNMMPSPSSLTPSSGGTTPTPTSLAPASPSDFSALSSPSSASHSSTSSPSSPTAFAAGVSGVSSVGGQSPGGGGGGGGGHRRLSTRLAGGRSNNHHQHHQFGLSQEGESPLHASNTQQQQQHRLSTNSSINNRSRRSKHSSLSSTSAGLSSLIPPPPPPQSPISPISPISPAANGGTVGTSRLSSRW